MLQHVAVDMKDDAECHPRSRLCSRMILMHTCVAVCCSALQYVTACCSMFKWVSAYCSVLQYVTVCRSVLQYITVCCSVLCDTNNKYAAHSTRMRLIIMRTG